MINASSNMEKNYVLGLPDYIRQTFTKTLRGKKREHCL